MPAKEKKRIKPVIEEVVEETPESTPSVADSPEENKDAVVETVEPTTLEEEKVDTAPLSHPEPEKHKKENKMNLKLIVVITIVSALVAAFVSGGVYVYLSGVENVEQEPENEIVLEPNPSPTTTPTPTAQADEVEISEYSVQVLNGSGAIGAAGAGEDILSKAGFSVENTGNAANYNFENTVVQTKADISAGVVGQVRDALEGGDYEVEIGDSLPASSAYDIVVTIGRS